MLLWPQPFSCGQCWRTFSCLWQERKKTKRYRLYRKLCDTAANVSTKDIGCASKSKPMFSMKSSIVYRMTGLVASKSNNEWKRFVVKYGGKNVPRLCRKSNRQIWPSGRAKGLLPSFSPGSLSSNVSTKDIGCASKSKPMFSIPNQEMMKSLMEAISKKDLELFMQITDMWNKLQKVFFPCECLSGVPLLFIKNRFRIEKEKIYKCFPVIFYL